MRLRPQCEKPIPSISDSSRSNLPCWYCRRRYALCQNVPHWERRTHRHEFYCALRIDRCHSSLGREMLNETDPIGSRPYNEDGGGSRTYPAAGPASNQWQAQDPTSGRSRTQPEAGPGYKSGFNLNRGLFSKFEFLPPPPSQAAVVGRESHDEIGGLFLRVAVYTCQIELPK